MSGKKSVLALVLCVLLIAASAVPVLADASVPTIVYASWDVNQEPGMQAIAAKFNEQNADINVVVEVTPWEQYTTKLEAAAGAGVLPDLFWQHPASFLQYVKGGKLTDITDLMAASEICKAENFPQDLLDIFTYGDRLWAVPKDYDTIALWYNKALFDAKGIPYPDDSWDWAKLKEVAAQLNDPEAGIYGYAAYLDPQQVLYNFMYQNGGYPISDDRMSSGYDLPESIEAGQFLSEFALVDETSPTIAQFANTGAVQMFESGKVAMGYFGSWMTSEFYTNEYTRANCDLTVLPKGKQRASVYNGLGNAMAADTKNPDAAWRFLEYLGSKEGNEIQSAYGAAIPAYKGVDAGWVAHFEGMNVQVYPQMLEYAVPYRSNWEGNAVFRNKESNLLSPIFSGEVSIEEGFRSVAEAMNDAITG